MDFDKKYIKDNLKQLGYKYDVRNVFQDFVMCCAYSFVLANKNDEYIEKSYNNIINKYTKEEVKVFTNMFIGLTLENNKSDEYRDILGEIYEEFGLSSKNLGQFFTPMAISDMMAKIIYSKDDFEKKLKEHGYISVSDPACGSGRTLFSFLNVAKDSGMDINDVFIYGADISDFCCCMTYLNLCTMGASAMIENMDTLSQKHNYTYFTPALLNNKKMLDCLERDGFIKREPKKEDEYEQ